MQDLIGYDEIIENSMRLVIFETLKKVEKSGLPGKHYFIVTFLTKFPGAVVPKHLMEKYHDEMVIAVQYQYRNLVVGNDNFKISLSFGGKYEKITVPYKAITSFTDPAMNFTLRFSANYNEAEASFEDQSKTPSHANKADLDLSAKVISLDAFRKNRDKNN